MKSEIKNFLTVDSNSSVEGLMNCAATNVLAFDVTHQMPMNGISEKVAVLQQICEKVAVTLKNRQKANVASEY